MPRMYHTCPECGSNLDPGEACDCQRKDPRMSSAPRKDPRMSSAPRLVEKAEPQEKGGSNQ